MNRLSKKDICNLPALIKKSAPDGQEGTVGPFFAAFRSLSRYVVGTSKGCPAWVLKLHFAVKKKEISFVNFVACKTKPSLSYEAGTHFGTKSIKSFAWSS